MASAVAWSVYAIAAFIGLIALTLVAVVAMPIPGGSTYYQATILVDGREYESEAVLQMYSGLSRGPSRYGRILTFRLPDGRVIVLNTLRTAALECPAKPEPAGKKKRYTSRKKCTPRSQRPATDMVPDGYVFDDGEYPQEVRAFQFELGHPRFGSDGDIPVGSGGRRLKVSGLSIKLVSFTATANYWRFQRDNLDRDFPGYDRIWYLDGMKAGSRLSDAGYALGLPNRDR
jgi:hypothetical protein